MTNNDTFISVNDEFNPRLIDHLKSLSVVQLGEKCTHPGPIWNRSQYALIIPAIHEYHAPVSIYA